MGFFIFHLINPLSPNSDQHLISPHKITDSSNIHVTRMNEMITKEGMSQMVSWKKHVENSVENMPVDIGA